MDLRNIKMIVKSSISQVLQTQELEIASIKDDICPINDLKGFDSVAAVEATLNIEAALGIPGNILPDELFWSNKDDLPLTIENISKTIVLLLAKGDLK
jgi:hypothetical protein